MNIVFIGDIIESKKLEDRKNQQEHIQSVFDKLNEKFKSIILSNFTLTLGDEFQVILKPDKKIFRLIDALQIDLGKPIFEAYGEIVTDINPELSIGADGPAFWNAREAIEEVHSQNWGGKCNLLFKSGEAAHDRILNTLILSQELIKSDWTSKQKETATAIMQLDNPYDFQQKDLAQQMKISESSLSKRLSAGNIKAYLYTQATSMQVLETYYV